MRRTCSHFWLYALCLLGQRSGWLSSLRFIPMARIAGWLCNKKSLGEHIVVWNCCHTLSLGGCIINNCLNHLHRASWIIILLLLLLLFCTGVDGSDLSELELAVSSCLRNNLGMMYLSDLVNHRQLQLSSFLHDAVVNKKFFRARPHLFELQQLFSAGKEEEDDSSDCLVILRNFSAQRSRKRCREGRGRNKDTREGNTQSNESRHVTSTSGKPKHASSKQTIE